MDTHGQVSAPPIPGLPDFAEERVAFAATMLSVLATGEPTDAELDPYTDLVEWYPELSEVLAAFSASVKADVDTNFAGDADARTDALVEDGLSTIGEMALVSPALRNLDNSETEVLALAIGAVAAWWCFMEDSLFCSDAEAQTWIGLWIHFFVSLQIENQQGEDDRDALDDEDDRDDLDAGGSDG